MGGEQGRESKAEKHSDPARSEQDAAVVRAVLEAIGAPSAMLDERGRIAAVNAAWQAQPTDPRHSPLELDVGQVYLEARLRTPDGEFDNAQRQREGIDQVLRGERAAFILDAAQTSWGGKLTVTAWQTSRARGALLIRHLAPAAGSDAFAQTPPLHTQHTLAERRLRRSEVNLAASQRMAHLGSWELDLIDAGDLTEGALRWSDEVYRIWGYAPGGLEVTYDNFLKAVHPDDRGLIGDAVAAAIREHRPYDLTHRIVRPDGEERVVRELAEFEFDPVTGQPMRMIGTVLDVTELRLVERLARESEARLAFALDAAGIGDWDMDLRTNVARRSLRHDQCFGYAAAVPEWGYDTFLAHVHADDRSRVDACFKAAMGGDGEYDVEFRTIWADGTTHWLWSKGRFYFDGRAAPYRVAGIQVDITTRKAHEAAIERSVERLTEAQRIGRIGDWEWDPSSGGITWSPEVFDIVGRDPSLGPPRSFEEMLSIYDAPSQQITREKVELALTLGQAQEYELLAIRPDGERVHLLARAMPRMDATGLVIGLYGTVQDISERKRAELQALRLASIVEFSDDAIISKTLDGVVTSWNRAAERIFGYPAGEMIGTSIARLIPPTRHDEETEILNRVRRGTSMEHFETVRVRKDGHSIDVSVTVSPIRDASGTVIGASKVARDISDRKKLERQFLRAQRLESIGTLAGGIAHDLNNVLSPIMLSSELLRMNHPDASSQELLDAIDRSALHGADLVRQVLSFARGVEGDRLAVRVNHLVRDVERTARDTFLKHIDIQAAAPADLWRVVGDPTQLKQVLVNLSVNARDAMPDGGRLSLSAENVTLDAHDAELSPEVTAGPYVLVRVEDSGTGIAPTDLDRIFDPFFTTKEVGKGTGLGLSTSLAIVKSHGGFIRVYSEPGTGTKFNVYLPAAVGAAEDERERAVELPRGHGELVLVVDDEPSIRQITQKTLDAFGYRVVVASDGAEAVALYARRGDEIAVVLTDMMMPVMDGAATIRVLRKLNPAVRIIAASGLVHNAHGTSASLGIRHFLPKPYGADALLTVLRACLDETP